MAKRLVLAASQIDLANSANIGGKAAILAELKAKGFPIPDFFVVATDAYEMALQRCEDAASAPRDVATHAADSASVPMPARLADDIRHALGKLREDAQEQVYVVRSSAVGEDGKAVSFAGQFESYLGLITDDEVIVAIQRCWASAWAARETRSM
jgi:pyruvate,water dikinase